MSYSVESRNLESELSFHQSKTTTKETTCFKCLRMTWKAGTNGLGSSLFWWGSQERHSLLKQQSQTSNSKIRCLCRMTTDHSKWIRRATLRTFKLEASSFKKRTFNCSSVTTQQATFWKQKCIFKMTFKQNCIPRIIWESCWWSWWWFAWLFRSWCTCCTVVAKHRNSQKLLT